MSKNNLKNCFLVVFILGLMIFISGCRESEIVEKLANNQALTAEETKIYVQSAETKADVDKKVEEKKQTIAYALYQETTDEERGRGKRIYRRLKGIMSEFDINSQTTDLFGFPAGAKISLPSGHIARVVGVFEGHLWFHVEGKNGATFSKCQNKEELFKEGYKLIEAGGMVAQKKTMTPKGAFTVPITVQAVAAPAGSKKTPVKNEDMIHDSESGIYFNPIDRIPYKQ